MRPGALDLFANGLTQSANSLVGSANLIKKVYFPRLIIPISSVLSGRGGFRPGLRGAPGHDVLLWRCCPTMSDPLAAALLLLALVTALGVGLWLSALNVQYRDVRYTVPFLTQFWMFATPIAYPSSLVPEPWRTLYGLNPMVGVVEGFRWALLGKPGAPGPGHGLGPGESGLLVGGPVISGAWRRPLPMWSNL